MIGDTYLIPFPARVFLDETAMRREIGRAYRAQRDAIRRAAIERTGRADAKLRFMGIDLGAFSAPSAKLVVVG